MNYKTRRGQAGHRKQRNTRVTYKQKQSYQEATVITRTSVCVTTTTIKIQIVHPAYDQSTGRLIQDDRCAGAEHAPMNGFLANLADDVLAGVHFTLAIGALLCIALAKTTVLTLTSENEI